MRRSEHHRNSMRRAVARTIGSALHIGAAGTADGCCAAGSYSDAPIVAHERTRDPGFMSSHLQWSCSPGLTSPTGRQAVEPLDGAGMSPGTAISALTGIEATLHALERECMHLASALLPPDGADGICGRYRAAAARWPATSAPLSHERLAEILATLHDAAAGVRLATERCRRVRQLLPDPEAHETASGG